MNIPKPMPTPMIAPERPRTDLKEQIRETLKKLKPIDILKYAFLLYIGWKIIEVLLT